MKTEIPNGTRVKINGRSQRWTVCDTKMSRSGKTRLYCLRGVDVAVRPYPIGTTQVLTTMWVCDWEINELHV